MIKILLVTIPYEKTSTGGAAKSFLNIFNGLKENKEFQLKILALNTNKLINKFLNPLGLGYFVFIPKILRKINKFKPDVIITQSRITFPAIASANIKKIPIISIVRDTSDVCPKRVDIIGYGKACPGLKNKTTCNNCINYWRSLRILIGNKAQGWQYSLSSYISTVIYKFRYFVCQINLFLINKATVNLVASELMKKILSNNVDSKKIKVENITPIKNYSPLESSEKKNQLLFVIPKFNASYKGLDFVLKLSQFVPKDYKIVVVGSKIPTAKLEKVNNKIINYDQISREDLNKLYQSSQLTLVPTFCTEAFGRIIIESFVNKTPVISSPNCGANSFFIEKDFLKVVPLKLSLWIEAINDMIKRSQKITDNDIKEIFSQFSIEKSKDEFSNLIKQLLF